MEQTDTNFYRDASANFGAGLTPWANQINNASGERQEVQAFNSRVRSSQSNGAGPNANPGQAPWNFTDMAFGQKSIVGIKSVRRSRNSILTIIGVVALGYIVWKYLKK